MPQEGTAFHSTVTVSYVAPFGRPRSRISTSVFKDQSDGFRQVSSRCSFCPTLSIRARDFSAISDIPFSVTLTDCCKLVAHS